MTRPIPLAAALVALLLAAPAPAQAGTRRLAVVVGSNAGSGAQPALRFAETDAAKLARTLVEVGQVEQADVTLLLAPSVAQLDQALDALQRTVEALRQTDARIFTYFYFSGHSDGEVLELGKERYPFARLKARLAAASPDVRLTIIDACRSGSAVAAKGGKRVPAFDIRLADSLVSSGEVVLASSAADELALESPEVRGSYFTHFLISGLRGAADTSGDGLVTLGEAYRFAYDHTVAATSGTLRDPQHPTYDFRLTGQGELVLSTLAARTAGVELPADFERVLVLDLARDQVVAEIPAGAGVRLALPPGRYALRALRDGSWSFTRLEVAAGQMRHVEWSQLAPLPAIEVAARGGPPNAAAETKVEAPSPPGPVVLLSLGVAMGLGEEVPVVAFGRLSLSFRIGLLALSVAAIGGGGSSSGMFPTSEVSGQLRVGAGLEHRVGVVSLFGMLELGGGLLSLSQSIGVSTTTSTWFGAAALRAGIRLHLGQYVRIELAGEAGGVLSTDLARFVPGATLGAGVEF